MTKGNRLSKRKRNVLRRDDYFYFHHYSFQICITDQAWSQYDWIYGQIPFLQFVRLFKSPLFFSWLAPLYADVRTYCSHVKLYSKRARLLHSHTRLFHLFTHYLFMVHLAILKQAVAFSVFPNTIETPRNEAVYYRNLLSISSLA